MATVQALCIRSDFTCSRFATGSSSDTTGGHVILAGGVGTPVGTGRGGVVLDGPLFFTGTHRSVAVGVTAGSVAPINLGYLVNILEVWPVLWMLLHIHRPVIERVYVQRVRR